MKIDKEFIGKRLDLALMQINSEWSRSTIKKLLAKEYILVNGEFAFANYKLKEDDEITIKNQDINKKFDKALTDLIKPENLHLKILFEDENTLAINKPAGINSHPANRNDSRSVLNGVYYLTQDSKEKNIRLRLVNRLDKDTSGVILISKNLEANNYYSKLFEEREVEKMYYALVKGRFINLLNKKNKRAYTHKSNLVKKGEVFESDKYKGRRAITTFELEQTSKNYSLIRVTPQTGRTHQIRVHLKELGYPIVGDKLYDGEKFERLMLHSYSLKFKPYKKDKEIEVIADLPREFY